MTFLMSLSFAFLISIALSTIFFLTFLNDGPLILQVFVGELSKKQYFVDFKSANFLFKFKWNTVDYKNKIEILCNMPISKKSEWSHKNLKVSWTCKHI